MRNTETRSHIIGIYRTSVPPSQVNDRNGELNSLYRRYNLNGTVRDCEEVAVAYGASLRHAWASTTVLSRYIKGNAELESMLATRKFRSNVHDFVATSLTRSPWVSNRAVSYRIRVTELYRKRVFPLTYTSVFAVPNPEVLAGPKSYRFLEDEIRVENGTTVEKGTLEITFHCKTPISESEAKRITERYASLGHVCFEHAG